MGTGIVYTAYASSSGRYTVLTGWRVSGTKLNCTDRQSYSSSVPGYTAQVVLGSSSAPKTHFPVEEGLFQLLNSNSPTA